MDNKAYFKNITTLFKGSSISQLMPILASPLLTKIYTPDEFGEFSKFLSLVLILVPLGTLKYDQALLLPRDQKGLERLVSLIILTLIGVTTSLTVILFLNFHFDFYKLDFWILVPVVFLAINLNLVIEQIAVRLTMFVKTSISISLRSALNVIFQISLGFNKLGVIGLIISNIIGALASFLFILKSLKQKLFHINLLKINDLKNIAKKYIRFPIYILPSEIFASVSNNFLPIILASKFSLENVGYFYLTTKIIGLPTTIVGRSISQVFYSKISENYRTNKKSLNLNLLKNTFFKLVIFLVPIAGLLYIMIDFVIVTIFGEDWISTSVFLKILAPFYFIKLVSSSFSSVLIIYKKQRIELATNILLFALTILTFIFSNSFEMFLSFYSLALSGVYISLMFFYYYTLKND
ncbi:oligosaccharide flippase family protein [Flavobacteriaceae bacterium]|jgi:O-antigen/teichoic acid export membrane protein|nr:oligosaccharide flippase family protein [Flavobacteriaceae bacterium]